jgi:ADP-ribosylglycohydrolase
MNPRSLPPDHNERIERVALALDGLSVGDGFGERFFSPSAHSYYWKRQAPPPPWPHTDDTEMALAIAEVLDRCGRIDQDELAAVFARRYRDDPQRGYGATAHEILRAILQGVSWQEASCSAFDGRGSMGNGGAMRVAPVGAYFADDFSLVEEEARLSAEVTHGHAEGQAGAIAVAIAAAWAWRNCGNCEARWHMLETVLDFTPPGETRSGIEQALAMPLEASVADAAAVLGNGAQIIAQNTVPFALWCACRHLDNFENALWSAVSAGGDIDTNCAIIGGIVSLAVGREGIPVEWLQAREQL